MVGRKSVLKIFLRLFDTELSNIRSNGSLHATQLEQRPARYKSLYDEQSSDKDPQAGSDFFEEKESKSTSYRRGDRTLSQFFITIKVEDKR